MIPFDKIIKLLKDYKEEHGDCLVPYSYTTDDGIHLGQIVYTIRRKKAILDSMDFVWKAKEQPFSFEKIMKYLIQYKEEYGHCLVPQAYTTEDGIALGWIVQNIRCGGRKTTSEEKAMLNELGFIWEKRRYTTKLSFEEVFKKLQLYKEEYGDCLVPRMYTTDDGIHLGSLVSSIRSNNRKISADEKAMLDNLGFVWKAKRGRKKTKVFTL